jgi:hypothetical protein
MNCLNGERYVKEAIDSVYAQTFSDWEIVFFDNASSDGTADIARQYDARLKYYRNPATVPLGAARRLAMERSQGEWIGFLDHDDQYLPAHLARHMAAVAANDYVLSYAGYRIIGQSGHVLRDVVPRYRSGEIVGDLLRHYEIGIVTALANTAALRRHGISMRDELVISEEYNLFMRLAAKGRVSVIPDILGQYRVVSSSVTEQENDRQVDETLRTLADLRHENPGIEERHPRAFAEAEARATYYRARSLMQTRRFGDARVAMRSIRGVRAIYVVLYLVSFWPRLWDAIHDRTIKARLTRLLVLPRRPIFLRADRAPR